MRSEVIFFAKCGGTMVTASHFFHALHSRSNAPCGFFHLYHTQRSCSLCRWVAELQQAPSTSFGLGTLDRKCFAHEHVGRHEPGSFEGERNFIQESSCTPMPQQPTFLSHPSMAVTSRKSLTWKASCLYSVAPGTGCRSATALHYHVAHDSAFSDTVPASSCGSGVLVEPHLSGGSGTNASASLPDKPSCS